MNKILSGEELTESERATIEKDIQTVVDNMPQSVKEYMDLVLEDMGGREYHSH